MRNASASATAVEPRLLGTRDLAAHLGISSRQIFRLIDRGVLRPVRLMAGRNLFDRHDVEQAIAKGKRRTKARRPDSARGPRRGRPASSGAGAASTVGALEGAVAEHVGARELPGGQKGARSRGGRGLEA